MTYKAYYESPIGRIMLASDGKNLIGLWNDKQKYFAGNISEEMLEQNELPVFIVVKTWLDAYFKKERPDISGLPLAPKGSEFRKIVWDILCEIPYGETITYGEIGNKVAKKMGKEKMSGQAVRRSSRI